MAMWKSKLKANLSHLEEKEKKGEAKIEASEQTVATVETAATVSVSTVPHKVEIPNVVRQLFVDFTIAYLLEHERPTNIDKFALHFFHRKGEKLGYTIEEQNEIARRHLELDEGFLAFPSSTNSEVDNEEEEHPEKPVLPEKFKLDKTVEDWISKFTIAYLMKKPAPDSIILFGVHYCRKRVPALIDEIVLLI